MGIASALSPMGVTMIVPTLGLVADTYSADFAVVQFLVSAYLLGLGAGQPFHGFLCDLLGRRSVLLVGFGLFVVASFACIFVDNLTLLIVFRFLQALGVSVGTVASRAVVRDTRGPTGTAVALSYIAVAQGISPIIAPMLGGWLGALGGIELVFVLMTVLGFGAWLAMYLALPETLPPEIPRPNWSDWLGNYGKLLGTPSFVGYTLIFGFVQGSFFAFLAVGAGFFDKQFGLGPAQFGTLWGFLAITYVLGATFGARMTQAKGPDIVLKSGVVVTLIGGWLMLILTQALGVTLVTVLLPMVVLMSVAGLVTPGSLAGAVNSRPEIAGTSSGLSSAVGIVVGGSFTVMAGFIYKDDFTPVAVLICVSATLTALSWLLVRGDEIVK
ncbi:MAG: Bcr/CflA family efflux MFS transporter [Pseudomonadota bacterium]